MTHVSPATRIPPVSRRRSTAFVITCPLPAIGKRLPFARTTVAVHGGKRFPVRRFCAVREPTRTRRLFSAPRRSSVDGDRAGEATDDRGDGETDDDNILRPCKPFGASGRAHRSRSRDPVARNAAKGPAAGGSEFGAVRDGGAKQSEKTRRVRVWTRRSCGIPGKRVDGRTYYCAVGTENPVGHNGRGHR